jgi:hypothetical protein
MRCVTRLRLWPVSDTASGMPCPSTSAWCLLPGRARRTGLGAPLLVPAERPCRGWSGLPPGNSPTASPPVASSAGRQGPVPHIRLVPRGQASPAGHPRAEGELVGQVLPLDAGVRTNRIPHRACRSETRGRPAISLGAGCGSNGSISSHSSSGTIHGREFHFPAAGASGIRDGRDAAKRLLPGPLRPAGYPQAQEVPCGFFAAHHRNALLHTAGEHRSPTRFPAVYGWFREVRPRSSAGWLCPGPGR